MNRSFTDRVFAGVCGGMGDQLPIITPWGLRLFFVGLTLVSNGIGVLVYVALWWSLPQESLVERSGSTFGQGIVVLSIVLLMVGSWLGHLMGFITGPGGQAVYWQISLVTLSTIYFLHQVRGS